MLRRVLSAFTTVVLLAALAAGACAGCTPPVMPADCCAPDGSCPDPQEPMPQCLASQAPDAAPAEQGLQVYAPALSTVAEVSPANAPLLDPVAAAPLPADEYSPPDLHLLYSTFLI